jgi:putative exporter of polyketide antibiotics
MTLFSIGYLVSSFSSDSKKVVLISIVVFIFSYILNVISGLTTDLSNLKYFSLIYYFGPSENIIEYSIPVFLGISVICFLLGLNIFKRRDISIR